MYCIAAANSFAIWSLSASANVIFFSGHRQRTDYSAQRKPVSDCDGSIGLVGMPVGTLGSL